MVFLAKLTFTTYVLLSHSICSCMVYVIWGILFEVVSLVHLANLTNSHHLWSLRIVKWHSSILEINWKYSKNSYYFFVIRLKEIIERTWIISRSIVRGTKTGWKKIAKCNFQNGMSSQEIMTWNYQPLPAPQHILLARTFQLLFTEAPLEYSPCTHRQRKLCILYFLFGKYILHC